MSNSKQLQQMKKVHKTSMDCIKHLVTKKGYTIQQAEDMVMQTLKESAHYLQAGLAEETIATLKMTYLDQSVEDAAKDIIKQFLK